MSDDSSDMSRNTGSQNVIKIEMPSTGPVQLAPPPSPAPKSNGNGNGSAAATTKAWSNVVMLLVAVLAGGGTSLAGRYGLPQPNQPAVAAPPEVSIREHREVSARVAKLEEARLEDVRFRQEVSDNFKHLAEDMAEMKITLQKIIDASEKRRPR